MIITIGEIEYSGDVLNEADDKLQIMLRTDVGFDVLTERITNAKSIVCKETIHGTTTEYNNVKPVSMTTITNGVYMITFSTKAGRYDSLKEEVDRLNGVIDQMLITMLEG